MTIIDTTWVSKLALPSRRREQAAGRAENGGALASERPSHIRLFAGVNRDVLAVFALALLVRLIFSVLMSDTYDKNEFVYLGLGRDVAGGSMPYRDFPFFHPPGILVLLAYLNPLTAIWWPLVRLVGVCIDSITAALVWRVANHLYGGRAAVAAGALYAVSPVVLVSAIRVDQEVIITALGLAGIALLLTKQSRWAAAGAGMCLGAAVWIKYPMLIFLPVYLLAAPRRALWCALGFLVGIGLLFFPYLGTLHQLYHDTVAWQLFYRYHTPLDVRLETTAIFWLLANPFTLAGLMRRNPLWLVAAFATGGVFVFTSSVYSPYFVPIAPYAALLGGPVAARLVRVPARWIAAACLALTVAWVGVIESSALGSFVQAARFSDLRPVIQLIDRTTPVGTPILGNRLQFAYLAGRPWVGHYFWDDHTMISAKRLERLLTSRSIVVLDTATIWSSYPPGFSSYVRSRYVKRLINGTAVWLPARRT